VSVHLLDMMQNRTRNQCSDLRSGIDREKCGYWEINLV